MDPNRCATCTEHPRRPFVPSLMEFNASVSPPLIPPLMNAIDGRLKTPTTVSLPCPYKIWPNSLPFSSPSSPLSHSILVLFLTFGAHCRHRCGTPPELRRHSTTIAPFPARPTFLIEFILRINENTRLKTTPNVDLFSKSCFEFIL
jgi:hypothetical protein